MNKPTDELKNISLNQQEVEFLLRISNWSLSEAFFNHKPFVEHLISKLNAIKEIKK